ncbi:MAG TPA: rhomboid family intramembrane serine protease [Gemmatimonadaceae bacterium]|nr:rhomboid family intramembrane serine protease [Gemmatimonadaceae bacterium]
MIPLGDDLPTLKTPWMTYTILAVTFGVFLLVEGGAFNPTRLATSICVLGMVPAELTHRLPVGVGVPIGPNLACVIDRDRINLFTPLLSIFLHGGWAHILGNSLYFWVFGNNVEDVMGPWRFLAFYLLCGLAAALAHVVLNPASAVPTVGASGAISGIMGAYLLLYPRAHVRMLFPLVIIWPIVRIQAWAVLLWWFGTQVLTGLPELQSVNRNVSGGVAVWAHVGGFVAGLVLIRLFSDRRLVQAHRAFLARQLGRYPWA